MFKLFSHQRSWINTGSSEGETLNPALNDGGLTTRNKLQVSYSIINVTKIWAGKAGSFEVLEQIKTDVANWKCSSSLGMGIVVLPEFKFIVELKRFLLGFRKNKTFPHIFHVSSHFMRIWISNHYKTLN